MRQRRDISAFSEFVEARSHALLRTAYLMVGDHQLAQDLLQEALIKTLIAWPRLATRRRSTPTCGGRSCEQRSPGGDVAPSTSDPWSSRPIPR